MDEEYLENILDNLEEGDGDYEPKKSRRKRNDKKRKIKYQWKDDEIVRLIAIVEKQPSLWDAGSVDYKLSRLDGWSVIVDELNISGVDIEEAKTKWSSLRVSFKQNLNKLREKKSGQGASDSKSVVWRHFKQLLFLEANNVRQSTPSTSTLDLPNSLKDNSVLDDFTEQIEMSSTAETTVGKRKKRLVHGTSKTTTYSSPAPSSSSACAQETTKLLKTAVDALQATGRCSAFCEHLLFEMRELSNTDACNLRRALSQTLWTFLSNLAANKPMVSPVNEYGIAGDGPNTNAFAGRSAFCSISITAQQTDADDSIDLDPLDDTADILQSEEF